MPELFPGFRSRGSTDLDGWAPPLLPYQLAFQDAFLMMDVVMVATSRTSLAGQMPALWVASQQGARTGRICPICGSPEIFDVTGHLNPIDPAVSRILACKCGAILTLYPPRQRKATK